MHVHSAAHAKITSSKINEKNNIFLFYFIRFGRGIVFIEMLTTTEQRKQQRIKIRIQGELKASAEFNRKSHTVYWSSHGGDASSPMPVRVIQNRMDGTSTGSQVSGKMAFSDLSSLPFSANSLCFFCSHRNCESQLLLMPTAEPTHSELRRFRFRFRK